MTGKEALDEERNEDDYFGFGVDAGMGGVADIQTQAVFKAYWAKRLEEDPDIDPLQRPVLRFAGGKLPGQPQVPSAQAATGSTGRCRTRTAKLPIFALRLGGTVIIPSTSGYDAKGEVCAVYVRFIDIEALFTRTRRKEP